MWIEEVTLENVKCFQSQTIKLGENGKPYPWVTFLGENGTGKTTVLQALGVSLAGEKASAQLMKPYAWVRKPGNPNNYSKVTLTIRKNANDTVAASDDPSLGDFVHEGSTKFSHIITGEEITRLRSKEYEGNTIVHEQRALKDGISPMLLGITLYSSEPIGWFCAGYGAFRRLAKEGAFGSKRPDFQRRENFRALFNEDFPIETFESWLMYLDHVILKNNVPIDKKHLEITKSAINSLLPDGNTIEGADIDGKVYFNTPQGRVPTIALSDGFRSILALAGDLIWRMIQAFPESEKPLEEQGVVLIDEIDIHLHPKWQRSIAGLLRKTFPNIQFIVATHSPIVAAGAGSDAVTYGFYQDGDQTKVERIEHIWAQSVDDILKSKAFELVSEFSEETQSQIDKYFELKRKRNLNAEEQKDLEATYPFVRKALGPNMGPSDMQLENEALLKEKFG